MDRPLSRVLAAHQPNFLPWLGLLHKVGQADVWVLADDVQFSTGSLTNRNRIRTASGWQWLTVPVLTRGRGRRRICDVEILAEGDWRHKHLQTLEWNYSQAPFYAAYAPAIEAIYRRGWTRLVDLNMALLHWLLDRLGIEVEVRLSSASQLRDERSLRLVDMARACNCEVYLAGSGASRDYLDERAFAKAGVDCRFTAFEHPIYTQCHAGFEPNMSILDLLFNCGSASREVIFGSA